jgi:hypothetical protein
MNKGSQQGTKGEVKARVFTVAFFQPFFTFSLFFFRFHPISHVGPRFFGFSPFLHVEIEKGKKAPKKTAGIQQGRKKGAKKGGKKATVNNHNRG